MSDEESEDHDEWLLQAHKAGLFIDDEDLIFLGATEGDGSRLVKQEIKEEPQAS